MSEFRRRLMVVNREKLPYSSRIEYLQTSGATYINTGITPKSIRPILEVVFYKPSVSNTTYPIGSDGSGDTRFSIGFLSNGNIEYRIGTYHNNGPYDPGWYKIKLDGANGAAYLNDVLQFTYTIPTFANLAICLFRRSFRTVPYTQNGPTGMKISSAKLWDDTTLLLDLIPVRIGSIGYMYNLVDGEFFGNSASSGHFILGPDIH